MRVETRARFRIWDPGRFWIWIWDPGGFWSPNYWFWYWIYWIQFNRVCLLCAETFDTLGKLHYALGGRTSQFQRKVILLRQFLLWICVTTHTTNDYLFAFATVLYARQCFNDIKLLVILWLFYF